MNIEAISFKQTCGNCITAKSRNVKKKYQNKNFKKIIHQYLQSD